MDQRTLDKTAAAGMRTAFGKVMAVRVVEFDGDYASIILSTGNRVTVNRLALLPAPEEAEQERPVDEPLEAGLYESDGTVFKVQISKTSNKPYAKRLVLISGQRLMSDGSKARLEYEYAPGAVRSLTAENRMDLETAKRFGIEYGICIVCGAFLKDADSVEQGIGPVCRRKF